MKIISKRKNKPPFMNKKENFQRVKKGDWEKWLKKIECNQESGAPFKKVPKIN